MVIYTVTHNDTQYSVLTSNILGIEGTIESVTKDGILDIDELFSAIKSRRNNSTIDYVSMEEVSNNVGNVTSFIIRVGNIKEVLEQYLIVCKEE